MFRKPTWRALQVLLWRTGHSSVHLSTANPDTQLSCKDTHINEPVIKSNINIKPQKALSIWD